MCLVCTLYRDNKRRGALMVIPDRVKDVRIHLYFSESRSLVVALAVALALPLLLPLPLLLLPLLLPLLLLRPLPIL